jgi:hypothetical protein
MKAAGSACSKGNFGWILAQSIHIKEELIGRIFSETVAVAKVYGYHDLYLKEIVTGINTGLRRLRSSGGKGRRLACTVIENV